jgi:hypothetical protein
LFAFEQQTHGVDIAPSLNEPVDHVRQQDAIDNNFNIAPHLLLGVLLAENIQVELLDLLFNGLQQVEELVHGSGDGRNLIEVRVSQNPAALLQNPVPFALDLEPLVGYPVPKYPRLDLPGYLTPDDVDGPPQFGGLVILFEIDDVSQELAGLAE